MIEVVDGRRRSGDAHKVIGGIGFQANPDTFPSHGGLGNGKLYFLAQSLGARTGRAL